MELLRELLEKLDLKLAYHDKLNPKIWKRSGDDYVLDPKVKTKLMQIGKKFAESLELNVPIDDYVITGSNVNYNWTAQSDLDLHLLVKSEDLKSCTTCRVNVEDCLQAKKSLWNDRHEITIYGIPVEVYVTTEEEKLVSDSGTYSLLRDAWEKKPEKRELSLNSITIQAKVKELVAEIDELVDSKSDDERKIRDLLDKIKRMRQAGLSREGEFSVENLTFKALRNNGYIDKIRKYFVKAQDDELSLKETQLNELFKKPSELFNVRKTNDSFSASTTVKGRRIDMFLEKDHEGNWDFSFYEKGHTKLSGSGGALEVFSTLKDFLLEFIEQYQPERIEFTGASDRQADFYSKILKRLKLPGYKSTERRDIEGGRFWIEKT